jgi:hypothetical protein
MPADDRSERERRLAAALRANLQRRKQQARQRPADEQGDEPGRPNEARRDAPESDPPGGKA